MTTAKNFKGYSAKSKAKRALVQTYKIEEDKVEKLLLEEGGKWGFFLEEVEAFVKGKETKEEVKTEEEVETEVASSEVAQIESVETPLAPVVASIFGGLMGAKPPAVAAPTKRNSMETDDLDEAGEGVKHHSSKGLKIEKNRAEANGVTMPSQGGICRVIWDHLTAGMDKGVLLSLKEVRAELSHLDETTVSVQYYRWRKYNGIVGRQAKKDAA